MNPLQPLPAVQPLVLQLLPPANPVLPQPNWGAFSGAMQIVGAKAANIPNCKILAMNANMLNLVGAFNLKLLDLVPMWAHNALTSTSGILHYLPGIVAGGVLPVTMAEVLGLSSQEYCQAIIALHNNHTPDYMGIYI
ncbi:hypothetical protein BYT27DRAFT_7214101 [Phlegmacium glaucopus]|nr:hypothetical protein BYT27DRAFT_7214101 [Phlegmacium glaucopus]